MEARLIKLQGKYVRVGIATVAAMLELWCDSQLTLTEDELEELSDALIALLSDARDERWRLKGNEAT